MSERRTPPDPSMEEILASIRRIISDDGTKPGAPPAPAREAASAEAAIAMPLSPQPDGATAAPPPSQSSPSAPPTREDVLELTQVLREDGAVVNILRPEPSPRRDPSLRPELADEPPLYRPRVVAEADGGAAADLVSPGVAAEAAAAIAAIGRLDMGRVGMGRAEPGRAEAPAAGSDLGQRTTGGGTMDDLVRELLRPMLKEWLDARLPGLVEAVVREEIERIVRRSNLR